VCDIRRLWPKTVIKTRRIWGPDSARCGRCCDERHRQNIANMILAFR
jgi:hypothetical protein